MVTTEVEEVDGLFDRINRIYRIEIGEAEEAFDVGYFDWRATLTKIRLYPALLRLAGGDNGLCSAEAKALDGADQGLLPTVICAADRVVATFRDPMDVLTPERSPPKTRHP